MTPEFSDDNISHGELLRLLGGREWLEICLDPMFIGMANEDKDCHIKFRGLQVIFKASRFWVIKIVCSPCHLGVNRYVIRVDRYITSSKKNKNYRNNNLYAITQVLTCYTKEEFITNFQLITNTTLFL